MDGFFQAWRCTVNYPLHLPITVNVFVSFQIITAIYLSLGADLSANDGCFGIAVAIA